MNAATETAETTNESAPAREAVGAAFVVDIRERADEIADDWATLEARRAASPYQGRAWQEAFALHGLPPGRRVRYAVVREPLGGRAVMLLPLVLTRRGALTVASVVGGKHANFHMPLFCPLARAQLAPDAVRAQLSEIARRLGIDAYVFRHLPLGWRDEPNPLALPEATPAGEDAYWTSFAELPPDAPAARLGKDARKKLRQKRAALQGIGPVRLLQATSVTDCERVLDAFLAQKAARMRVLGLPNPFDCPHARAFLQVATRPVGDAAAPIALYALEAGDRIVATFGAARDGTRASGMFISFDASPEIARCSPGDLLIQSLVEALRAEGYEGFDLGVGAARYKDQFCERRETLVELTLPVTWRGRVYCGWLGLAGRMKRRAKASRRLRDALSRTRRLLGGLTRPR